MQCPPNLDAAIAIGDVPLACAAQDKNAIRAGSRWWRPDVVMVSASNATLTEATRRHLHAADRQNDEDM